MNTCCALVGKIFFTHNTTVFTRSVNSAMGGCHYIQKMRMTAEGRSNYESKSMPAALTWKPK